MKAKSPKGGAKSHGGIYGEVKNEKRLVKPLGMVDTDQRAAYDRGA